MLLFVFQMAASMFVLAIRLVFCFGVVIYAVYVIRLSEWVLFSVFCFDPCAGVLVFAAVQYRLLYFATGYIVLWVVLSAEWGIGLFCVRLFAFLRLALLSCIKPFFLVRRLFCCRICSGCFCFVFWCCRICFAVLCSGLAVFWVLLVSFLFLLLLIRDVFCCIQ